MNGFNIDWLVIGSITKDKVYLFCETIDKLGGVPVYGGLTLKWLGQNVLVCTRINDKDKESLQIFPENSIQLSVGSSCKTTTFHNYIYGDIRRQKMPTVSDPINLEIVKKIVNDVRPKFVLLGPLHPMDISTDVFSFLKIADCYVAADAQGLLRRERNGWIEEEVDKNLDLLLCATDWLKVSLEEINLLKRVTQLNESALIKKYGLKEIIITANSHGGVIWSADGTNMTFSAKEVEKVSDTTGAGDVFFAAYLEARVCRRKPCKESTEQATIIAAEQVKGEHVNEYL